MCVCVCRRSRKEACFFQGDITSSVREAGPCLSVCLSQFNHANLIWKPASLISKWTSISVFAVLHFCQTCLEKLVCPHQDWEILHQVLFLFWSSVQYQSSLYGGNNNSASPPSNGGSSPIVCERCGQVCRGEVVRVKNTHFHVQCFTCQGKKKKHTYTQTNTFISFLSCDRCLLEWRKHTITSKSFCFVQKPEMMVGFVYSSYHTRCI